jgi:two-component system, NarL family, nitrate/nitrite response regulator NarL
VRLKVIRILIVDDHPVMREGLKAVFERQPDFKILGEASDGDEAVKKAVKLNPDVITMDVRMPYSGLKATTDIMKQLPQAQILILTVSDNEADVIESVKAGARGYLLKGMDAEILVAAIRTVAAGGAIFTPSVAARLIDEFKAGLNKNTNDINLTVREMDVLALVAKGASNKEIAITLNISEPTVKAHLRNVLSKLHMKNRSQAAVYASQRPWFGRHPGVN